jgi:uncharacterized repeat protein (TIGR01451 family)
MRSDFRSSSVSVVCRTLGISAIIAIIMVAGCGSPAAPAPVLTISSAHTGSFSQGQQGATYTVTVSNTGTAPTTGTVTMTETVPSGLTLVSMTGTGWTCSTTTCTRADALAIAAAYPTITVTVNVAANATSPLVNAVGVSGGGAATANGTDSTTILVPVLSITKTHTGNFAQSQQGATYTVTVKNTGAASTNGTTVTVTEAVPSGLTLASMSGSGWTCANPSCTRTDALTAGSSYPTITVTVNVAANATSPQANAVSVSGGGSVNANTTDSTTIITAALSITKSTASTSFTQGQVGATYTVTVSDAASAAPTNGTTVTVTDTLPGGLTATGISGTGWACVLATLTCTRSDVLQPNSSYPVITVTVNVGLNAPSPQVNNVSVSGGGSPTANGNASTPVLAPVLSITKSHSGNFAQGQNGATYTVTVKNNGTGPTNGTTVTVTDTVPSGLTLVSMVGTGWTCPTSTCTRLDALAAGTSYPAITVTVNVASNASTPQVNAASVSGGGSANANTTDSTIIIQPVLSITKTHSGNFTQGQTGATYTVTVSNTGTASTTGKVTVTETVPSGLTLTGMTGTGWTCPGTAGANTCDRSDVLANGSSYPTITVTVNVGATATSPQVNAVAVSGGGSANGNTTDSTTIGNTCPTGGNLGLLSGKYAFALQGFDSSGNVALIGGVLTADGSGNLTAGAVDMNLSAGVTNLAIASGSNYTIGSDARGCMAITTTAGTQNYRFSLGASGNGHMIDFDATGPFTTGVLRKQTPADFNTTQISGNYAFGIASPLDSAQGGGKFAAAGVINLSGGSVTGGSVDTNHYNSTANTVTIDGVVNPNPATWPASPLSFGSGGSYSVSGSNGRGTLSFTPSGGSVVNEYIYVVSHTEVLLMSADARTVNTLFAGSAQQQPGGPFGNTSLNSTSVFYDSKPSSNGGTPASSVEIGIVTTTGATATFTFAGYNNGGGNIGTPTTNTASGTFSVAANGRVTLFPTGGGGGGIPEFYLFSPNSGFAVDSGTGAHSGLLEAQTSTSVSGTYAYGSIAPQAAGEKDSTGAPVFTSGNVTGTGDNNAQGTLSPNGAISSTYSVNVSGVVFIPASCTPGTSCDKIGTVITSSKFVMMDAKSSSAPQNGTTTPSMSIVDK